MIIAIRPARETDEKSIKALIRQVHINPMGLHWQRFLIAEEKSGAAEARFVGCVQIKPHSDGTRELASLAVIPECHGQGIGTQLINALLEGERGVLYLRCRQHLAEYYQKFGFVLVDRDGTPKSLQFFVRVSRLLQRWFGMEAIVVMRLSLGRV